MELGFEMEKWRGGKGRVRRVCLGWDGNGRRRNCSGEGRFE
jgi:hypothetical protein